MHAVMRQYSGSGTEELFDALQQREAEVRELIGTVPGFVSYVAFRTGDGEGTTVTVCQDKAGTDESTQRAAAWVVDNIDVSIDAPSVTEGDTSVQF
jgi:hypothetical protein